MAPTNGLTYSEAFAEFEDEDLDTFELENFETFSPEKKKKGGFLTVFTSLKSIFVSKKRDKGQDRRKAISMPEFAISQQVENKNFLANPVNRRVTVPDNIYHSYSTYEALLEDEKEQFEVRLVNVSESKSSELDYDYKRKIGVGSFGAVYLVENRYTREINAIKEIDYTSSIMKRLAEKERDHLFACSSPFIVSLVDFYYKEDSQICLVMEYLGDANLLRHLVRYGKLSETLTKFYTAQLILAIEYMHNVNLIHRDLKPENIMITRDGYIKLVDLGLSKQAETADSMAGTLGYKAPEMLLGNRYTKAVDWWSLGIIIYEMLAGARCTPCQRLEYENGRGDYVIQNSSRIYFPVGFPKTEVRDLISRLLKNNSSQRLGSGSTGSADIKIHPWFYGVDWMAIYRKEVIPPSPPPSKTPYYKRQSKFHRIVRACP